MPSRPIALLESLLVTLIWASSPVLTKLGLAYVGPLTVSGLRYFLGGLLLLPLVLRNRKTTARLTGRLWLRLLAIAFFAYAVGNGAYYSGLLYLPATTVSLLGNLSPLLVLFLGILWLKEIPTRWQVVGVLITMAGSAMFFSPGLQGGAPLGLLITGVGLIGLSLFAVLGRDVARDQQTDTLTLTAIPLVIGGAMVTLGGLLVEGWPQLTADAWAVIVVLAVLNSALAYALYNHALQVLTALEMKVLINTSVLGTALLAWWFLGETLTGLQVVGMVVVIVGVMLVQQLRWRAA